MNEKSSSVTTKILSLKWWQASILLSLLIGLTLAGGWAASQGAKVDISIMLELEAKLDYLEAQINIPVNSTISAMVKTASYIISVHSSYYCMINGSDDRAGRLEYYSTNATLVVQYVAGNLTRGDSVYVKNGLYPITYVRDLPSNSYWYSHGATLYLPHGQPNNDQQHQIFRISGQSNVTIQGFNFDGHLGDIDSSSGGAAIFVTGSCRNIHIFGNTFYNWRNFGIYVLAYGAVTISDMDISNNEFYYGGMWNPIAINGDTNGHITSSTISLNRISYFSEFGIALSTASGGIVDFVTCTGNTIAHASLASWASNSDSDGKASGFKFEGATDCTFTGNTISDVDSGIYFDSNSARNIAANNIVMVNATLTGSGRNATNGCYIYGTNNAFKSNTVTVGFTALNIQAGIYVGTSTACTVQDNTVIMGTLRGYGIIISGTNTMVMGNHNIGFAAADDFLLGGATTPHYHDNFLSNSTWAAEL